MIIFPLVALKIELSNYLFGQLGIISGISQSIIYPNFLKFRQIIIKNTNPDHETLAFLEKNRAVAT
jgi:hypothetical protein